MSEKPQPMTDAERRLAMLISDVPGTSLVQPEAGMPAMTPMRPKPGIPYETAVSNGPTPAQRFVGSLVEFKDKAMDLAPMTAIPRFMARTYHAYDQGDTKEALLRATQLATLLAMPAAGALKSASGTMPGAVMGGLMGTQPGARLSSEVALANFRAGAQMPEHAARMLPSMRQGETIATRTQPSMSTAPSPGGGYMTTNDIAQGFAPSTVLTPYERAVLQQRMNGGQPSQFDVIPGGKP